MKRKATEEVLEGYIKSYKINMHIPFNQYSKEKNPVYTWEMQTVSQNKQ